MANAPKTLALTIMEREYRVNCPAGAEEELRNAARHLNDKMEEIKNASSAAGKVIGTDRIAVIAALNITHHMLEIETQQNTMDTELKKLHASIDAALDQDVQLEL
ncbi:cell division protein ZapA [Thalassolituus sp.]|uniref:cell division protein ZapA n=1 Tax=Thalassolituus sp. TaxID=2030822 RepID=UPI002A80746E|nr:cell division protein ZapA [Thalassolituus sp.]